MNRIKSRASALLFSLAAVGSLHAAPAINTFGEGGGFFSDPKRTDTAIRGYDPVAYFVDGRPVKGSAQHVLVWQGAKWQFASQAHLEAFKADPGKYAPQYGGYCAYGVAEGHVVKIEPDQWAVIDGKLYLNYDESVSKKWKQDPAGYIRKADAAFDALIKR
ncbi:MAG: hypothetical protein C0434_04605 [Xanthomonadaceae bacterium]|nr:hypothetical protein [Xanthomonadaceae bacterium]